MAENCFLFLTPSKDMRTHEEDLKWIYPSHTFTILGLHVSFTSLDWVLEGAHFPYQLEAFQGQPFPLPNPTQSHSGPAH